MLPLLRVAADGKERSVSEVREQLAEEFSLSEEERSQLLQGGRQPVCSNRVAWTAAG